MLTFFINVFKHFLPMSWEVEYVSSNGHFIISSWGCCLSLPLQDPPDFTRNSYPH